MVSFFNSTMVKNLSVHIGLSINLIVPVTLHRLNPPSSPAWLFLWSNKTKLISMRSDEHSPATHIYRESCTMAHIFLFLCDDAESIRRPNFESLALSVCFFQQSIKMSSWCEVPCVFPTGIIECTKFICTHAALTQMDWRRRCSIMRRNKGN